MTDKIKSAFDSIRAEDKLKRDTKIFLQNERAKLRKPIRRFHPLRYAAALASVIIILMSGVFTYNLYFTPAAYVDIDVNPSFELTLNRLGRVIESHNYDDSGGEIIYALNLTHKGYEDALAILLDEMAEHGYIEEGGLVSVTLQTDDKGKEAVLLASIQAGVEEYIAGHHQAAQLDIFPVSRDTRNQSHELGVSPAKYLAIRELMAVDPAASVDGCRSHTISEIKELTRGHSNHHDGNTDDETPALSNSSESGSDDVYSGKTESNPQEGKNHGKSSNGRHHGTGH